MNNSTVFGGRECCSQSFLKRRQKQANKPPKFCLASLYCSDRSLERHSPLTSTPDVCSQHAVPSPEPCSDGPTALTDGLRGSKFSPCFCDSPLLLITALYLFIYLFITRDHEYIRVKWVEEESFLQEQGTQWLSFFPFSRWESGALGYGRRVGPEAGMEAWMLFAQSLFSGTLLDLKASNSMG